MSRNNDNVFVYTVVRPWHILIPYNSGRQDEEKRERIGKLNNDNDQTSQSNIGRNTIQ